MKKENRKSMQYLSTLEEFLLTSLDVLGFATPGAEDRSLFLDSEENLKKGITYLEKKKKK